MAKKAGVTIEMPASLRAFLWLARNLDHLERQTSVSSFFLASGWTWDV